MELQEVGGELRTYADGEVVFDEGEEGQYLFIVLKGKVRIRKEEDLFSTVLAECEPGDMFGELAMIDCRPHSASAVAEGPTELALYDRETFARALKEDPGFAQRMIESLAARLRATTEQLQRVCTQYVRDRTEMALIQKAVLEGEMS
jgi:CRP/FNR family transcriptional regulator